MFEIFGENHLTHHILILFMAFTLAVCEIVLNPNIQKYLLVIMLFEADMKNIG